MCHKECKHLESKDKLRYGVVALFTERWKSKPREVALKFLASGLIVSSLVMSSNIVKR